MATSPIQSTLLDPSILETSKSSKTEDSADRFLKLLVAQMQNQDPMNPMDNAQVTSQMAQISTVSGIDKLNTTVESLSGSFAQMQAMQGILLVGHDVVLPGNKMLIEPNVGGTPAGVGGFDLKSAADKVKVEMLSVGDTVVGTIDLGKLGSGAHNFTWDPGSTNTAGGIRFRVTATRGGESSQETTLMRDHVNAVNVSGNALTLELQSSGSVAYASIKAFN